jgi:ABC-2 type transport system permease protein
VTTDATTHARAAGPRRRVLAQAGFELGSLLRNGEQLLVSLVLPSLALVGLSVTASPSLGPGRRIDVATAGVVALCVISAAFTAQAISTGFDRRYAVLRYLGVTPLGRGGLVAGKVLATLAVEVVQVAVIAVLGLVLNWRPAVAGIAYAALFVVVGTWAFVALALLLAGTLRAEAVLAIANLVWVLLLGVGGVIVPRTELPDGVGQLVAFLPSAGLADGLRSALVDGSLNLPAMAVVLGWGVVSTALAARLFRFDD